jgi:Tol biopolymer transport system component
VKYSRYQLIILFTAFIYFTVSAQEDHFHPELEWKTIKTEHFYVHFHEGTERTAKIVAKIAEEIYKPVTTLYNHEPDERVSFVIKDYDDFSNGATYFFNNKIEIWASALDFDLRGTHNWLRNVVTHEFTHLIQIQSSLKFGRIVPAFYFQWLQYESERRTDVLYGYPNGIVSYPVSGFTVPMWFAEGVAQYNRKEFGYESWDAHRDMILRMYILDSCALDWNEMGVFGKTSLGNESVYNAGYALVRYIAATYGEDKLREISRSLSSITAFTIDAAIEKVLGKKGKDLYAEWIAFLSSDYNRRIEPVRENSVTGALIGDVGFGNLYPSFSPDGQKVAYISNKGGDYFSPSSIYLYDIATKKEQKLVSRVRSKFSWSPDGKKIFYSQLSRDNPHWSNYFDVWVYDINKDKKKRLTEGLRAYAPSVSPDGLSVTFIGGGDGTCNLFKMGSDGTGVRQLTFFKDGEQLFNPSWSPDGSAIIFDYSAGDGRDIAVIPAEGGEITFLINSSLDERNAVYSIDGKRVIYSANENGIFNVFEYELATKDVRRITNVLGGAFMPTVNSQDQIAFATYTSTGYKIALIDASDRRNITGFYAPPAEPKRSVAGSSVESSNFEWHSLRNYDDKSLPDLKITGYKNIATDISIIPFLRVDNYNPKDKGIDKIKLGVYAFTNDMLDRYGIFAGLSLNTQLERDIFATFDYRGKIPGLFNLGLEPSVAIEGYNITRKTDASISLPLDTLGVDVTYNLLEFDFVLRHKVLIDNLNLELRYAHSRYTAQIGSFTLPYDGPLIAAFSELYLIGNNVSATWNFDAILPSRTMDINPVGTKIRLKYEYEFNKFNPTGEYDITNGVLVARYQNLRFHRMDARWREYMKLPGWKHTLTATARGGTIFGPPVDNFFNYYIGGLAGMKGYSFYAMGGNEFATANLTYRFPVLEDINLRFFHMIFDHVYGAVYGDVGSAWTGGAIGDQKFKRDAGLELRLEATSYYAFPTRIFFSGTYGFDTFDYTIDNTKKIVTYGKEWNFHFGVMFGFDFD